MYKNQYDWYGDYIFDPVKELKLSYRKAMTTFRPNSLETGSGITLKMISVWIHVNIKLYTATH